MSTHIDKVVYINLDEHIEKKNGHGEPITLFWFTV